MKNFILSLLISIPAYSAPWTLIEGKHWQRQSHGPHEATEAIDTREGNRGSCPAGMARVEGKMIVSRTGGADYDEVGALQDQACTNWISKTFPKRCGLFNEKIMKQKLQKLPRKEMGFCMDRFEYPNQKGANPVIMMTYKEAGNLCKAQGKRLCSDEEWVFACEGEEGLPYPYGYERSQNCNADSKEYVTFAGALKKMKALKIAEANQCGDTSLLKDLNKQIALLNNLAKKSGGDAQTALTLILEKKRSSPEAAEVLEALWAGEPSGERPQCKSPFGVYDLTGSIDEWTGNKISGGKYKGAQKGGYWGPVRARCRPATIAHSEGHYFYQQGTRCCSDK